MKQITLSTGEWIFLKVPSDAYDFLLSRDEVDEPTYIYYLRKNTGNYRDGYELRKLVQPEYYSIIGKAIELSEEQAGEIVEQYDDYWEPSPLNIEKDVLKSCWKDYRTTDDQLVQFSAKESLHTLIQSLCLDYENVLILKKK